MPNHNYASYIEQAVESILHQSIDDWELIIIDDGSSDCSLEVLRKYRDNKKITIIQQENKGLNVTNNVAIRLARGKYIVRVDADDYVDENFLLVLSNVLEKNPHIGLVFPDWHEIDVEGNIVSTVRRKRIGEEVEVLDQPAHGACTMFRRDLLITIGSYSEEFRCQDGYDIWIKFIKQHRPYNVNIPLFYYRQHQVSLTRDEKRIMDTKRAINRKFVEENGGIKTKILGIIPITTVSAYRQNRPFVTLNDKCLMWYTLLEASQAKSLDKIVVSTDDDEVMKYTQENFPNIYVYKRQSNKNYLVSADQQIVTDILEYFEDQHNYKPEAVCILYISTPLRKAKHIDHAADALTIFKTDSVVSVQEELAPLYRHEKYGLRSINFRETGPRLERDAVYKSNGAVFLHLVANLSKGGLVGNVVGHITMLPEESVKINSDFEFWLAESILAAGNDEKS